MQTRTSKSDMLLNMEPNHTLIILQKIRIIIKSINANKAAVMLN